MNAHHDTEHDPSLRQLALAVVILIAIAISSTLCYIRGYNVGFNHVLNDSEITVTSFDPPDAIHDLEVNIEIDGDLYVHTAWIG